MMSAHTKRTRQSDDAIILVTMGPANSSTTPCTLSQVIPLDRLNAEFTMDVDLNAIMLSYDAVDWHDAAAVAACKLWRVEEACRIR